MHIRPVVAAGCLVVLQLLLAAVPARGQARVSTSPFLGGVPAGQVSADVLPLSLAEAIRLGLASNLGMALARHDVRTARGERLEALSALLPSVHGTVGESRQVNNLAAFGFTGFPGVPTIVGPFTVFDARVFLSQRLLDLHAIKATKAAGAEVRAREHELKGARDVVVLVVSDLYLESLAAESRVAAAAAQRETADVLFRLATDLKAAGLVPQIDVLRAETALLNQRQRLIVVENELSKDKLRLARVIGLPVGQEFTLTDAMPFEPVERLTLDEALRRAYEMREDYRAAEAMVEAAELERQAVTGEALPTVHLDADYGDIGSTIADSHSTYRVAVNLRVPIFEGGRLQGRRLEADGRLARRRAELADFRARVDYEVRSALLDVESAADRLEVADTALRLAEEELTQAQDRFAAGVSSNVEVVQAQESVATATENRIASLLAHNVARATLALALGVAEEQASALLGDAR